jgi:hypothetical protein
MPSSTDIGGKMAKLDVEFAIFCDLVRAMVDDQYGPDEPGHFQVAKAAKAFEIWRVEQ